MTLSQSVRMPKRFALIAMSILRDLLSGCRPRDFSVRLWDGTSWEAEQDPRFTLVVNSPAALRRMLQEPRELSIAEAYLSKDLDVEGDIRAVFGLADYLIGRQWTPFQKLRLGMRLLGLPAPSAVASTSPRLRGASHSRERDRQAISYHYDVSNDFYRLWLDGAMIYSCAYFEQAGQDLDTAQQQKLEYICRKLRLRRGERMLDIGCGWGGLITYAARRYGVQAYGITLSRQQADLARESIRSEGLEGTCSVELKDFRDLEGKGKFDKIVSVGMFEHVGRKVLPDYFRRAWALLNPGGIFLNHGIAWNMTTPARPGPSFTDVYIFPDGDILPLSMTLATAESCGFEVRDVESLREHYAITLEHWLERLEKRMTEAIQSTNAFTCRLWKLYLAASAHSFRTGRVNVYQCLLVKSHNGSSGLPLTRADWYR